MSARGRRSDRVLITATAALIATALLFNVWAMFRLDHQERKMAEHDLEMAQLLMRMRIAGMVYEIEKQLRQEAASLTVGSFREDSPRIMDRWRSLLGDHWMISTVALADAYGNETALVKTPDGIRARLTKEGQRVSRQSALADSSEVAPAASMQDKTDTLDSDPRKHLWYSKALEDARNEPAWNLVLNDVGGQPELQLSLLLRDPRSDGPFKILMFEVAPTSSAWLQNRSTPIKDHGFLVMDSEGHVLNKYTDSENSALLGAMGSAVSTWTKDRPRYEFQVEHMGKDFAALLTPYALNGQTLYTGVVLDLAATQAYLRPERNALIFMLFLLVSLGMVLGLLWWNRRASIRRIREQERISRSQERQLAKVIGEREVLNREVHHRVKNNLQVVSSLLNLQASGLDDGPLREEFLRGKQRIDSIALVHHKLYGLKDLRSVDLDAFITSLTEALAGIHHPFSQTVICDVRTNSIRIDQDTAIGLGIILCELVTNAYRHAFPYATGGHIDIQVTNVEGDLHRLVLKDNGIGLDPEAKPHYGKLGLEIVEAMADQLDGSFHIRSGNGSTFEVLFRVRSAPTSTQFVATDPNSLQQRSAGL
jgi:two-component system, sensor histidine kinase PdtaS